MFNKERCFTIPHNNKGDAMPQWCKNHGFRVLIGYAIQLIIIITVLLAVFVFEFFTSFYNRFLLSWISQPSKFWAFMISVMVAYAFGTAVYTKFIWDRISPVLSKIPLVDKLINAVDKWRRFLEGAFERGFILVPYLYEDSRSLGVVTSVAYEENNRAQIIVAFWNLPVPHIFAMEVTTEILTKITPSELVAYFLSGGFSFQELKRPLVRMTLGEYVEQNLPHLLEKRDTANT